MYAGLYADIFILQVKATGGSPHQSQLPVDYVFWNATILHTTDMTQPSQSALSKQSVHSGKTSKRQDIRVGYFILPAYSQDTADASQVECVEPSLLPGICGLRLAAIQQCADNTVVADCHFCLHRQLGACPNSSCETGESCSCLPNPIVELCIQREVVSDGGAEVGELAENIEFIVVDGNDRRCFCILSQCIRLLQTDSQSEVLTGLRDAVHQ